MIQFRKVSKNYDINGKETVIIDGIDLTIAESEIFGLVGETGSGKSTILRMMTGFIEPDGGEIFLAGRKLDHRSRHQLVRETAQQKVLKVVFDGKKLADIGRRAMAAEPDKKQSLLARQQMDKLLDAIGDIECTMTVDKATGYAVQSEADLTPMARRLAHSIVTDMPKLKAAEKQQLMAMVDHATVHVATTASEFNAVKEIVIPAEVRAAKEAPKPQKKDTKKAAAV